MCLKNVQRRFFFQVRKNAIKIVVDMAKKSSGEAFFLIGKNAGGVFSHKKKRRGQSRQCTFARAFFLTFLFYEFSADSGYLKIRFQAPDIRHYWLVFDQAYHVLQAKVMIKLTYFLTKMNWWLNLPRPKQLLICSRRLTNYYDRVEL